MKVENKQINQKKQDSEGMSSDNPSEFLKTSRIMKKTILLLACMLSAISASAQLKVYSNGRVKIGNQQPAPSDILEVTSSSSNSAAKFQGGESCVKIYNQGSGTNRKGIYILDITESGKSISGVNIDVYGTLTSQEVWGVKSFAGCSTAANYGIWGGLRTTNITKGAGVFGSSLASGSISSSYQGLYAGYFYGDVRVTGTLYGTLVTPSSSTGASNSTATVVGAYTTKGEGFDEEGVSDKLQQVQLLQFYRSPDENKLSEEEIEAQREELRKARLARQESLTDGMDTAEDEEDIEDLIEYEVPQTKLSTIRYGLDTEQLKSVYPELVYEDANGNVSINYIEMIPLLVQAVNEVKAENAILKDKLAKLTGSKEAKAKGRSGATSIDSADEVILSLSQNNPNPFSTATSIAVSVPESIKTATLFVYDMSGKQVKRIDITERGASRINITSEGLGEGMYLYSLIADGKVVGTKKMILTK